MRWSLATVLMAGIWASAIAAVASQSPARTSREGVVLQGQQSAPDQGPAPPGTSISPVAQPDGFIGDAACLECHGDQSAGYANTIHGRPEHPRAPAARQGCESCHGPGAKHAEEPGAAGSIRAFLKMAPAEASQVCMSCHTRDRQALFEGSPHDGRGMSCVTCHSVHSFKSERAQLKTPREMQTCAACHRDKAAKVDRSGHMPLREGKMECSSCHNPHGSTSDKLLRAGDSIGETCTKCHADKRGPFLWEHAPTRDGCTTCHDPHGSANERMLVAKSPILCQRCHVMTRHPSTIYDGALIGSGATPSVRIFARSCVTCHATIHGSNHPSGQRFIR